MRDKTGPVLIWEMACTPDPHYVSQRHPHGGAYQIFDEGEMSALIRQWQQTGNEDLFRDIVVGSLDLIQTAIRKYRFDRYDEMDALTNECVLKLWKALPKYDATRGRAFSFLVTVMERYLIARVLKMQVRTKYVKMVEPEQLENWIANSVAPNEQLSDLRPLLRKLKTRFRDPALLKIQRRMVEHILSRDGRLWNYGSGRSALLTQLLEEYKHAHPEATRAERGLVGERLPVLYNYLVIQLRRLLYEVYAPEPLPRPVDEKFGRLWDEIGAEAFTKLVYVFADVIPAFNRFRRHFNHTTAYRSCVSSST